MSNCAIVGINWGDEGKGRMVDLIARDYDIVCRYQGGNNAGHTIVNEYGKFALHLIPSGICLPGVVNVLGNGVVIDLESLCGEIEALQNAGVPITPENFKISERATIVFPYHRALDGLEEARLKDKKYGSTLRGIAPVYSDKYQKKTIMMGELLYPAYLEKRLASILEWKNLTIQNVYGAEAYKLEDMLAWCREFGSKLAPYICDTSKYLYEAEKAGKSIMFEAQLGATLTSAFSRIPRPLPPMRAMPASAQASPAAMSTARSALSRRIPPAWAKARSRRNGSATRPSSCAWPAANTARPRAVRVVSAPSIWSRRATAAASRAQPRSRLRSSMSCPI